MALMGLIVFVLLCLLVYETSMAIISGCRRLWAWYGKR